MDWGSAARSTAIGALGVQGTLVVRQRYHSVWQTVAAVGASQAPDKGDDAPATPKEPEYYR